MKRQAESRPGCRSASPKPTRALSTAIEIALVGPLISCFDESNSAPTAVITIAVYSPYCGGMPAIWAYAIACGTATAATVIPATRSARASFPVYPRSESSAGTMRKIQGGEVRWAAEVKRGCPYGSACAQSERGAAERSAVSSAGNPFWSR